MLKHNPELSILAHTLGLKQKGVDQPQIHQSCTRYNGSDSQDTEECSVLSNRLPSQLFVEDFVADCSESEDVTNSEEIFKPEGGVKHQVNKIIKQLIIMFKNLVNYLRVIPIITTYYVFDRHVLSISNADGASMEPTIHSGDILIVDRFFFKFRPLAKDDMIVCVQPVNPEVSICKRIAQTPGKEVPLHRQITVPVDHYWVEGDNKGKSYDSRHHGCVSKNLVMGKVLHIIKI